MKLRPMLLPWDAFARASVRIASEEPRALTSLEPCGASGVWLPVPAKDFHVDSLISVSLDDEAMRIASFHADYLPCYDRKDGRARRAQIAFIARGSAPFRVPNPLSPLSVPFIETEGLGPRLGPRLSWLVPIIGRSNVRPRRV